jgi:Tfp pilus tip-associated adhesin PilY1
MFRPDPQAKPRWFGNLKRYQLILASDGQTVLLGDKNNQAAVNDQTGFISDCATSYWTSDSGTYWQNYPVNPSPVGACGTTTFSPYSDAPDGPRVEKGAVAEILRKGNNPTATDGSPTWAVNRVQYTTPSASSTALQLLSASSLATLSSTTQSWTQGHDTEDENSGALNIDNTGTLNSSQTTALTETRATIHGDVVHSRPLPINYGGNIVVYYGANDGNFRAVDAETGKEIWSFIPFEFTSRMERLRTNSPLVNYPNVDMTITPTPTRKDYFWDGSIGVLQNADNSKVWIYPTMRRGGRSVYALDVTNSASPTIKWKAGCPNLTDDTNCTGGMSGIGQTWAVPNVAPIKGYGGGMSPVVLLGGGYDSCEDANSATPACSSPKGAAVYVLDADSGSLVRTLTTTRSVAADVAVIDIDGDGNADYAYVLDTGGNVYRIDFVSRTVAVDGSVTYTPLASAAWTITKVAHTGAGRKFLFSPALFPTSPKIGKVYIAMGSGDREHPLASQYPFGSVTNRFYVYLDDLSASADNNLDDAAAMSNFTTDPGCGAGEIIPTSSKKGWYMDLNQYGTGEQTVTSPLIVSGLITFSTNRPIPPAEGSCSTPLGEARGYWVSLLNGSGAIQCSGTNCSCGGSRSTTFVGGGLPPSPVIGTVPVAGMPTTVVIGAPQRGGGASSPISPQKAKPLVAAKRKRVYNYIKSEN